VAVISMSSGSRVARVKEWVRVSLLATLWGVAQCAGASVGDARVRSAVKAAVGRIGAREGVDPRLVEAVAETESANDPGAVSPKGAVGVMQLMPGTARLLGVRDARNVEEHVTAGVRYLEYLQWLYRGDLRLALAAYSAGPGAVAKYRGGRRIWRPANTSLR
jgi:soluble lytic murein transglycosylase-like protein